MPRFWWERRDDPQYMALGRAWNASAPNPETSAAMSWANPNVVAFHANLLASALHSASWEGVELDLLRTAHYFPPSTPRAARAGVMRAFIASVRAALPAGAALGLRFSL